MRVPVCLLALVPLLLCGTAHAQVSTTTTRLSIDAHQARIYPSYASFRSPEIYLPVRDELAARGLTIQVTGATAEVRVNGERAASWPVARSPQAVLANGNPVVLLIGGSVYLPLRACAGLVGWKVDWDESRSLLRLGDSAANAKAPAPSPPPAVTAARPLPTAATAMRAANLPAVPLRVVAVPVDPCRQEAAKAALSLATAAVGAITPPGPGMQVVADATAAAAVRLAATTPGRSPIRTIVRRTPGALAFRGGLVQRNVRAIPGVEASGPLKGRLICVDAGHGGHSGGAQGLNGLQEKDACLWMAQETAQALQDAGATVIMTRSDDSYVSLEERSDFANARGADLFISIHCNAMPVHNTASGTETYYFTPQSRALAEAIHPQVVGVVQERDGGIRGNRGFAVIRHPVMPSVLVEVAFIDNVGDEAKLADATFRQKIGEAIRDGVMRYYQGR